MTIYPAVVKIVTNDKKAQTSGQISLFGNDTLDIKVDVPKVPEFDNFTKLRFEKEFVGLYLSGHPLQEYAHLISGFNFNIGEISTEDDDNVTEEYNNKSVELGAIITDIKKIYTRANHDEMAILTIEDLYGVCEVMVFPKIWDRAKLAVSKDSIVKVTGRLSTRGGEKLIILADNIQQLKTGKIDFTEGSTSVKKLRLCFNLQDENVKTDVMNVLSSYSGDESVVIKDTATGKTVEPELKIRECQAIIYELNNILGEENVNWDK
jgi:DNA polymerase-3 subunit alpha